jgi:predicted phage terminase large subunit-like protein
MNRNEKIEYLKLLKERKRRNAKRSLLDFTEYTFPKYKANWHHVKYAEKLDQFVSGEIKKLMIFMPPQHGKSELSTRRLPAYMLGRNPDLKIGVVAYQQDVASDFNRDVQNIMDSPEYKEVFDTRLPSPKDKSIRTTKHFELPDSRGSLVSVGVGGPLTSRTVDTLIIDDVYKGPETAWSQTVRGNVLNWYDAVGKTRLHNDSQQLIVFTRWHEEDLAGSLLRRDDDWEVVTYPAIKESEPTENDPREIGEALWGEKHSLETLEEIRKHNPIVFDSLYQQNPTPKEGLLFPSSEFKRFRMAQITDTPPTTKVAACDIADEGSDNLCNPYGDVHGKDVYVVDVIFTQDPIEVTQPRVAAGIDHHNTARLQCESNNGGKGFALKVKELKRGRTNVIWKVTVSNKHTRIIMGSGDIKENFYFLEDEEQNDEYRNFYYELTHYPKNGKVKHDDAADGITMLKEMINNTIKGWY